jgi:hypothetical protein
MPTSITSTWLSIGSLPVMDTDDSTPVVENSDDLVGQSFDNTNGLAPTEVTATDANDDAIISTDNAGATGESITADGVTSTLDAVMTYNVTITLGDGTTLNEMVGLAQLDDGRAFIMPATETQLDNLSIERITFDAVVQDDYGGMYNATAARSVDQTQIVCFAVGTRIETARGARPVERLRPGDQVRTLDHGLQPLRWVSLQRVRARGKDAPIMFRKGAWGVRRTLKVSAQHRMLIRGGPVEMHFALPEVLVPAAALVDGNWVTRAPGGWITYVHLMFDRHEIIFANGVPAESFYPGPEALATLPDFARRELQLRFPTFARGNARFARPVLRLTEARVLRGARGCLPLSALHGDLYPLAQDGDHDRNGAIRDPGGPQHRCDLGSDRQAGGTPQGQPAAAGSGLRPGHP